MSIRNRTITALRWRISAQLAGQIITGLTGLLLIRLLVPSDFGLMASAALLVGLAKLVSEMGLNAALVQRESIDGGMLRQIFGALLLWNGVLVAVLGVSAPLFAGWFGWPLLTDVIRVLAVQLLIGVFSAIPASLLARRIDFRDLSLIELRAAVAGSIAGIAAAAAGFGVWALVAATLATSLVRTAGLLVLMGTTGLPSFHFRGLLPELRFGARVMTSIVISYVNRKVDILIVGKLLGQDMLGAFSVGADVARTPSRTFMPAITRVMFPVYARLQLDRRTAKSAFLQSIEMLSLTMFPVFWGLSVTACDVVSLLFGAQWVVTAVVLQWLCLVMPFRTVERLLPAVTRGFGREDLSIRNALTTFVCLTPLILIGTRWGIAGVSQGWALAIMLATVINLRRSLILLDCTLGDVVAAMAPFLLAAVVMYGAVAGLGPIIDDIGPTAPRLAVQVIVGAMVYGGLIWMVKRTAMVTAWHLVRGNRSRAALDGVDDD